MFHVLTPMPSQSEKTYRATDFTCRSLTLAQHKNSIASTPESRSRRPKSNHSLCYLLQFCDANWCLGFVYRWHIHDKRTKVDTCEQYIFGFQDCQSDNYVHRISLISTSSQLDSSKSMCKRLTFQDIQHCIIHASAGLPPHNLLQNMQSEIQSRVLEIANKPSSI